MKLIKYFLLVSFLIIILLLCIGCINKNATNDSETELSTTLPITESDDTAHIMQFEKNPTIQGSDVWAKATKQLEIHKEPNNDSTVIKSLDIDYCVKINKLYTVPRWHEVILPNNEKGYIFSWNARILYNSNQSEYSDLGDIIRYDENWPEIESLIDSSAFSDDLQVREFAKELANSTYDNTGLPNPLYHYTKLYNNVYWVHVPDGSMYQSEEVNWVFRNSFLIIDDIIVDWARHVEGFNTLVNSNGSFANIIDYYTNR